MMKSAKLSAFTLAAGILLMACTPAAAQVVNTEYVLTTGMREDRFVYLGVDGAINGLANPVLHAEPGEKITVMLINGGEGTHDIVFPDLDVRSNTISKRGETTSITFTMPDHDAAIEYHDSEHEKVGMKGILLVGDATLSANTPVPLPGSAGSAQPVGTTVEYTLEAGQADGKMAFLGKGGSIDGQINPELKAEPGDTIRLTLFSGDGSLHNIAFDDFHARSQDVAGTGNSVVLEFTPDREGVFAYYCAIPGHRQAGMEGRLTVGSGSAVPEPAQYGSSTASDAVPMIATADPADASAVDIVRDPADIPAPIGARPPQNVRIDLETSEVAGIVADGATYTYWTFNGKVPGPFLRVREGDTVEVHLKNSASSMMTHSVDFHAVTGPGGGAVMTQTQPGAETMFTFKALKPGLYVYHCATPMVAQHIANGMYGLILVEPAGGLPSVDHEFYVMQGELYTAQPFGTSGALAADITKLLDEHPEYFVFNGASMALTSDAHAMHAKTGDTVRIFFGVGGPNFTSSLHVIGEIFDRVFDQASLTSLPLTDVQTTMVPPGGATIVELKLEVPGRYVLVDHALSRMQRGLAGYLYVDGDPAPEIINGTQTAGSGH